MKKSLLLFLTLISLSAISIAQPSFQWVHQPGTNNVYNYVITDCAADKYNNIYCIGSIAGKGDMDPATGLADTSYSGKGDNYFISKTNANGKLQWIKYLGKNSSTFNFNWKNIVLDKNNELVISFNFFGKLDADPSANEKLLSSHLPTYPDIVLAKFDNTGNLKWANNYGDSNFISSETGGLQILEDNRILISVTSMGNGMDVDPSSAVHRSGNKGASVICYNPDGSFSWVADGQKNYSYTTQGRNMGVDAANNAYYFSIGYYETTITKINSSGVVQWYKTLGLFSSNSRVNTKGMLVSANGAIFIYGTFSDTVDFDPGAGVTNLIASNTMYDDYFMARYDKDGKFEWAKGLTGRFDPGFACLTNNQDSGYQIVGSVMGNVKLDVNFSISGASTSVFGGFWFSIDNNGKILNAYSTNSPNHINSVLPLTNSSFFQVGHLSTLAADIDFTSATQTVNAPLGGDYMAVYGKPTVNSVSISKPKQLLIYPNPACEMLYIAGEIDFAKTSFSILSVSSGQEITEFKGPEINLHALVAGVHILTGFNKESQTYYRVRFVKL